MAVLTVKFERKEGTPPDEPRIVLAVEEAVLKPFEPLPNRTFQLVGAVEERTVPLEVTIPVVGAF